jgi:arylsulfatase A-like enzyme
MDRRTFLKTAAVGVVGMPSMIKSRAMTLPRKSGSPNIVFIMADQLRYQALGYAGDDKAITPNIDKLAAECTDIENFVVSMPVCCAYRATLLTGKYVSSTGMVINELRMNTSHRFLAQCLTEAGYETGYIGKWHLYANQLGHHKDAVNSYTPPGEHRLGFDGEWAAYGFHHENYGTYYHEDSPEKIFYGEGVFEPDAQTDMSIDYIKRKAKEDKPFFLVLSIGTPHNPWTKENIPEKYYDMFKDTPFPVPPNYSDELDPYGDAWSNIDKDPEKLQDWMRIYYAMTTNLDWNVGRLRDCIYEQGIAEDTIFIFTSDHGEMFGAQGRMKKNIFYDESARVPFLISWPGKIKEGSKLDLAMSNVDIMPTLLGLAKVDVPEEVEGMDLSSNILGKGGAEPRAAFLQNMGACATWEDGHEWRALRDKRYTYATYRVDGKELLFDNQEDPYQMKNLADDPAHSKTLAEFRLMLKEKMTELNDTNEASTWYRDNWIEDRIIVRTATLGKN